jgi:hypothetical protein
MIYMHKFLGKMVIVNWNKTIGVLVTFEDSHCLIFDLTQWYIISRMYEYIGDI